MFAYGKSLISPDVCRLADPDQPILAIAALAVHIHNIHFTDVDIGFSNATPANFDAKLRAQVGDGGGGSANDKGIRDWGLGISRRMKDEG